MKVEKAQYANKNNAFRINQAENKLKQIPEINEKTEQEKFKIQSENGFKSLPGRPLVFDRSVVVRM